MVSEARQVIQESEEKVQGLEQLAQEVYKQACIRIQELVSVAESLYRTNCSMTSEIEKPHMEVQSTRGQLEVQINCNQVMVSQITQFESQMSIIQNLFGHKDAGSTRLMSEVSRLQSSEARLEESAAPSAVATSVEAQRASILAGLLKIVLSKFPMSPMPLFSNHHWNKEWIQRWQPFSVCQTEWDTMSTMVRIPIQETPTATIVLHSLQVFGFQLAFLHHLLRTVTGQRPEARG